MLAASCAETVRPAVRQTKPSTRHPTNRNLGFPIIHSLPASPKNNEEQSRYPVASGIFSWSPFAAAPSYSSP